MHTGTITLGHMKREKVKVAFMPRRQFLDLTEDAIDDHYRELTLTDRQDLRATARDLEHFPLSSWLTERGCGCLVGETLIARDLVQRNDDGSVVQEVAEEVSMGLFNVGFKIDKLVLGALDDAGVRYFGVESVVLVDD